MAWSAWPWRFVRDSLLFIPSSTSETPGGDSEESLGGGEGSLSELSMLETEGEYRKMCLKTYQLQDLTSIQI